MSSTTKKYTPPGLSSLTFEFVQPAQLQAKDIQEIVDFLDGQDTSHPFQFPQWAQITDAKYLPTCRFLIGKRDSRIVWFASAGTLYPLGRIVRQFRGLVITRGPVCDDVAIYREILPLLEKEVSALGYLFIEANPDVITGLTPGIFESFQEAKWVTRGRAATSLRLNLDAPEKQLLAQFRKSTRYEIKRAQDHGICIVKSSYDRKEIKKFLQIYNSMSKRKGFQADSDDDLKRAIGWLSRESNRGALLLAMENSAIRGGVIIVRAAKRCWYVWGATESNFKVNVGHILQWYALLWAKAQGCSEYDFGGYTEKATSGPAFFKKGFGGSLVKFMPSQRKIVKPKSYNSFRLLRQFRGISDE
jgi:hypothetical protein